MRAKTLVRMLSVPTARARKPKVHATPITSAATAHRGLATPRNETMNMRATSATASSVANVMSRFEVSISSAERTGRPVSPASRPG